MFNVRSKLSYSSQVTFTASIQNTKMTKSKLNHHHHHHHQSYL